MKHITRNLELPPKKKRALGIYGNKIDSMRKQPFVTRFRHFTNVEKKEKKWN